MIKKSGIYIYLLDQLYIYICIYNGISCISKKEQFMQLSATWVALEDIMLREVSLKERNISNDLYHSWNLFDKNEVATKISSIGKIDPHNWISGRNESISILGGRKWVLMVMGVMLKVCLWETISNNIVKQKYLSKFLKMFQRRVKIVKSFRFDFFLFHSAKQWSGKPNTPWYPGFSFIKLITFLTFKWIVVK